MKRIEIHLKDEETTILDQIARLQQTLPKLELKEFETTCEKINQHEIKRVQLLNPIEFEQPLTTFKIITK